MKINMKNKNQSSKYARIIIKNKLRKYPDPNISRLFKRLRTYRRLSGLGDFFILELIASTMNELGIKLDRSKLLYAYNQSEELRGNSQVDKRSDLNQLLNSKKSLKFTHSSDNISKQNKKDDQSVVKNSNNFNYA